MKAMRTSFGVLGLGILLAFLSTACGGTKSDLERARHLLASGRPADAVEASEILEGLLEESGGDEKLEVAELYAGALLSRAGFNGVSLIVNVLHRENDNVAGTLRNVIEDVDAAFDYINTSVSTLEEIVGTLHEEDGDDIANLEPTVRDGVEDDYAFSAKTPSDEYTQASVELKKRVNYALGVSYVYRALYLILKTTGFDKSDSFDVDECKELLTGAEVGDEGVDAISLSFFRGRAYLGRANFDDVRLGAAKNNKIIKLVDDAQRGGSGTAIDRDRDGFIGNPSDSDDVKANLVCQYLEESL